MSGLVSLAVPPSLSAKDPHFKGKMQASPPLPALIFSPENIFPPHFQSISQLITSRQHLAARLSNNERILVAHMLVALKKKITFNQQNEHRGKAY